MSQTSKQAKMILLHNTWESTSRLSLEGAGEHFINYGDKECTGERNAIITENVSNDCPLQAEADDRTCCYETWLPSINEDDRIPE